MSRHYWTDPLTWAGNAAIFMFGVVIAMLGGLLPALFERANLDPAQAGSLFLFLSLGSFVVTVSSGPVFDKIGYRLILIVCSLAVCAALWLMATAVDYPTLVLSSALLGMGGGGLNLGANALVSDLYPSGETVALNRLGIFFGLGTFFIPFFIGILLESLGVGGVLVFSGSLALIPGVLFLLLRFPEGKHAETFPVGEAVELLKKPYVLLLGILLLFQSGNEMTTSGWLTTYLVRELQISTSNAAFYLSTFWAMVILGRACSGWFLRVLGAGRVVSWGALGAAAGVILLLLFPDRYLSFAVVGLIGFAMSPIFPTVMGEASGRYPKFSGTVIGALMSIALIGGMLVPWLAGLVVSWYGPGGAFFFPIAGFIGVCLIQTYVSIRYHGPRQEG
ncbi:MAG: MFS transporter [Acidobacteriota bacterium]|nr:MAG: MFS transporter [Acidobacteriota bacterium]